MPVCWFQLYNWTLDKELPDVMMQKVMEGRVSDLEHSTGGCVLQLWYCSEGATPQYYGSVKDMAPVSHADESQVLSH